jgi:MinD-like ATPase involved in chromosome partitioning or flagellar assembly
VNVWGVVASAAVWQVVGKDWDKETLPLGWVSFSSEEADTLIETGGITHLLVEARSDLLHDSLVRVADAAGLSLVALITGTAGEEVARGCGVSLRVRQPGDLHHILHPHRPPPVAASDQRSPTGLSIAVWGPTGAPGRTTVATSLASLMAGRGLRVVVIDADSRSGAIAPALGLLDEVPGFIASCRLADRGQLTPEDLRRLAHRYEQGGVSVDVLTGVTSGRHYPAVTSDTVAEVLEMAKSMWEVVIIDTGSDVASAGREPQASELAATTSLVVSDEAIALCQATPVGVARFARVIEDATTLRRGKPFPVVLNGVDPARRSLSDDATLREALRRFAGVSTLQVLARDAAACRQAEMLGVSVADCVPGSAFVSGLKAVAGSWVEDAMARRRRLSGSSPEAQSAQPRRTPRRHLRKKGSGTNRWRILTKRVFALR